MNLTASTLAPSRLPEAELHQARLYIQQTRDELLGSIRLLTPAQWEFQPAPERWSAGQIVAHVIAIQERVIAKLRRDFADAPPPPPEQDCQMVDRIILHQFPNRLTRFPSPIPPERPLEKTAAVRCYIENCAVFTGMLISMPGLRDHVLDAPPLKAISKGEYSVMDGYQWILAAAAHAGRHTRQILEVIADAACPLDQEPYAG